MTEALASYLPQDRRQALARGLELPEHAIGSALFADITGFTPLTEALQRTLGARRGAEAMTRQMNQVYEALIAQVERYGGSVVGFAGDSVTCWFADEDQGSDTKDEGTMQPIAASPLILAPSSAAPRAVACAQALQYAMHQFVAVSLPDGTIRQLAIKVAIASGPARHFVVGDPAIQYLDVLTGATLERVARGEHLARQGEILIDAATVTALGSGATVADWRADTVSGERFAVLQDCRM
jgi:adenylate cyclase